MGGVPYCEYRLSRSFFPYTRGNTIVLARSYVFRRWAVYLPWLDAWEVSLLRISSKSCPPNEEVIERLRLVTNEGAAAVNT